MLTKIFDIAYGGAGVGKTEDNRIVFVPYTIKDELVDVSVVKDKKKYLEAKLNSVVEPSAYRINPLCKYYMSCGGCQYMHIDYEQEVISKENQLRNSFKRIGGINQELDINVIPSLKHSFYRNSLTLHRTGKNNAGFYSKNNKDIINIEECAIADEKINEVISNKGIGNAFKLNSKIDKITVKTDGKNVSYIGNENILKVNITGNDFEFDYRIFAQVNIDIFEKLILTIESELDKSCDCLFDAYCGTGCYAVSFAKYFEKVLGIEEDKLSISFANKNKKEISNVNFYQGRVEKVFPNIYELNKTKQNVVLLNPPRTGVDKDILLFLNKCKDISQIIYVSCDCAKLARDLKLLCAKERYKIDKIFLFDMFPRTKFFETVVFLKK